MRTMKEILIGNRSMGLDRDIFISAEVGTTCNGDVETSKRLIDAALEAGLDAVKFQVLDPEDKFSDKTIPYTYRRFNGEEVTENMVEMLRQYVMTPEEWREVKRYADEKGVLMFATPDHVKAIELMEDLQMPAYKVATWDVTFVPMLREIAKLRKPTILDFGASNLNEITKVLEIFQKEGNDQLILVHCYHTSNPAEMNLRTIEFFREHFGYLSGFSASDENNEVDYLALAYQPVYLEKRMTLNRADPGHHHSRALEPKEMASYVKTVRELASARGEHAVKPSQKDLEEKQKHFRRIVASKDMRAGEILIEDAIACRRPFQGGIDALQYPSVIGRKLKKDIKENEPITWDII
ncbi:N-acetylneuraminate synthase family protein [Patescibacteria group bacterium]|nr:N-acetylneuraminate synthase family protein [Patescibacteria group bacterium]